MLHSISGAVLGKARVLVPGGVNSPVRAFASVGGIAPVIAGGKGSRIRDVDGNEYIDYVCSWGPLILGHADDRVVDAVTRAAEKGTSFGAPTEAEVRLAEIIVENYPAAEKVRLVNSGTEAVMTAVRLARAYTGRDLVIKFAGCYHGHSDALLAAAGSGPMTLSIPASPGVPASVAALTAVLPYNDIKAAGDFARTYGSRIACIIVEPVAANMGVIPPADGFLAGLRRIADETGAVLVFDEVITGFRLGLGGASERYGVRPDLVTLGKIIGGGLPVGACGGRSDIMDMLAPVGKVYQAGTLSGNPLATAAGIATIEALCKPGAYDRLEAKAVALEEGLRRAAAGHPVPVFLSRVGSMMTVFFHEGPVTNYHGASQCDTALYARFFHAMFDRGIYLAPSQFEAAFVSLAHTDDDIEETAAAAKEAFDLLR